MRIFGLILSLLSASLLAQEALADNSIAVGSLRFGTVNWQLDVIRHHNLDKKHGFRLKVVPVASKNAAAVALQGGGADVIVGDWFWVARNLSEGRKFAFAPYSLAAGGIITGRDSGIETVADLRGKKLGIAGGKIDKSWLLVRAWAISSLGMDLINKVRPVYGAPPLLSRLFERGEMDAVLTFWHYQARLLATGRNRQILEAKALMEELGIPANVPINGWIFGSDWAGSNPELIEGFLRATREAAEIMRTSDGEWLRLKELMKPEERVAFETLKGEYRKGIPRRFGEVEVEGAAALFDLLRQLGGSDLVGRAKRLPADTFWRGSFF